MHSGHVRLAQTYIVSAGLDALMVIPARTPPHKQAPDLADGTHRMEMCRLAFAQDSRCKVSDLELRRKATSYTVDTLEQLHRAHPEDRLCLLMGSDMFLTMTEWRNWKRIFRLAELCVGAREDAQQMLLAKQKDDLEHLGARCEIVPVTPLQVSSTEIRARLASGASIAGLVPQPVEDYILTHGLYTNLG